MGRGAETEGCGKCARIFMFISNFIIWVGSIILLILGVWTVVDKPYLEELLGKQVYASAAYIIIAVGVVAFFVAFLGCFGALKEVKCMLLLYFIITLLMFIVLLVGGILGYVFRAQATDSVKNILTQKMKTYDPNTPTSSVTRAWDDTQVALKCCGVTSNSDWASINSNYGSPGPLVPKSCCTSDSNGDAIVCEGDPNSSNSFPDGCYSKATDAVKQYGLVIGGVGVVISLLMLLGLVFSMILFKMIN